MISTSVVSLDYAYGASARATIALPYSFTENRVSTSTCGIITRIHKKAAYRWPRQRGHWGWTTQEVGNELPRWHMGRLSSGGKTQRLLNASAMHLDGAKLEYGKFRQMLFLSTAPPEEPDIFDHAGVAPFKGAAKSRANLLANPSFSMRGLARRGTPMWWSSRRSETTGTVEMTRKAFIGTHSVKMTAATGEVCALSQELTYPFMADDYTLSLWYMSPMPAGTIVSNSDRYGMYLRIIYADATAEMFKVPFELGTAGNWKRITKAISPQKEIYSIKICMYLRNTNVQTAVVYLGATQFEVGEKATSWSDGPAGIPFLDESSARISPVDAFIDEGSTEESEEVVAGSPITFKARSIRHLTHVNDFGSFWEDAIPSRAALTLTTDIPSATQILRYGWYALGEEGRSWTTAWRIVGNKLQQYNVDIPTETVGEFDIGEMWLDEDLALDMGIYNATQDPSFSRTLETFTFYKNRMWLVCKETEDGVTTRVLKVIYPWSRWPLPAAYDQGLDCIHLECRGDVSLDDNTGTATFIAPVESDPDQFLIKIDDAYYLINLEFDFFMLASRERRAIVRHGYTGTLVTI